MKDFITVNKETEKELMPMKVKLQKTKHRDDERVKLARSDIPAAYVTYMENPIEKNMRTSMRKRWY